MSENFDFNFTEEDYDAFCLAYMFTYRDFEGGTLGLAWTGDLKNAGGVCEKNGVSATFHFYLLNLSGAMFVKSFYTVQYLHHKNSSCKLYWQANSSLSKIHRSRFYDFKSHQINCEI